MVITTQDVTNLVAIIAAAGGLWTALHAHGVASNATGIAAQANTKAESTSMSAANLITIIEKVLPLLQVSHPPIPSPSVIPVESPTDPAWVDQLIHWLQQQHAVNSPNGVPTIYSQVLDQITALEKVA